MAERRTFEQSMSELDSIVKQLEGGGLSLDDSMKAFEKGVGLARECDALLNEAKGKVEKLVRDAGGNFSTEKFEPVDRDQ
ncbi:MAG TPA: exodeoxyribonuclease VII small subunit [bacterium]|nr:exodeoxyribonuclease VII small subunit [bacterium]